MYHDAKTRKAAHESINAMKTKKAARSVREEAPCAIFWPGVYASIWGTIFIDPPAMSPSAWRAANDFLEQSTFRIFIMGPYERACVKRGVDPISFATRVDTERENLTVK